MLTKTLHVYTAHVESSFTMRYWELNPKWSTWGASPGFVWWGGTKETGPL